MATLPYVPGTSWSMLLPVLFPCPFLCPLGELPTRWWASVLLTSSWYRLLLVSSTELCENRSRVPRWSPVPGTDQALRFE